MELAKGEQSGMMSFSVERVQHNDIRRLWRNTWFSDYPRIVNRPNLARIPGKSYMRTKTFLYHVLSLN